MAEVLVGEVLCDDGINTGHSFVPVDIVLVEGLLDGAFQGEVHYRRQVGVETVGIGVVLLPVGQLGNLGIPALAHDVHIRILVGHGLAPAGHRLRLVVRVRVDAQAVQTGIFNPPYGPLLEVFQHIGVVEVHIGHRRHEPAALLAFTVTHGGVGVHIDREERVHLDIRT